MIAGRVGRGVGAAGVAGLLACCLVGGASASEPATASARSATTITVILKPADQRGLNHLATAQGLTHRQRVSALARLLPTAAAHRQVEGQLAAAGFTVTHETAWTIDAAAPRTTADSTFGAEAARPIAPPSISSVTAAVLANSDGAAIFQPRDICAIQCHDGRDLRNAYSSPSHQLAAGSGASNPLTIATVQFPLGGGWNESDLTRYADSAGLPDPVASGQYKQFAVDGQTVPAASTREGGADEEVDLDQETLLSTAPFANQRAYFDTNANKAGYADALSQVLADVTQGKGAMGGGDPKIAALSTSWGACETKFNGRFAFPHDSVHAVGNILKSLTAAGVTIFAASGDAGIYDCGVNDHSTRTEVDYPASAPQVIGVGGTRLKGTGHRGTNNGRNWQESAWTCTSPHRCQGFGPNDTGGSGGGESRLFRMPAYQSVGIGHARFRTSTGKKGRFSDQPRRLVPDIASDGDPQTGFATLTTDPHDVPSCSLGPAVPTCKPKTFPVGGTSLSAPASAGMFTDLLMAHGATSGIGDIHGALYSAYAAHPRTFRDVTSGRNGRQRDVDEQARHHPGREFPVSAQKGYDTVTGLGAPLWPALAPYLFTPAAPNSKAALKLRDAHHAKHTYRVTARWGSTIAKRRGSASKLTSVKIMRGTSTRVFSKHRAPPEGMYQFRGRPGATYTLTVAARDFAGQRSRPITRRLVIPYDDNKFTFHGDWRQVTGHGDFGGSHAVSGRRGDLAKISARGRTYALRVRTGPAFGELAIEHGRSRLATIDLYSRAQRHRTVRFFGDASTPQKTRSFRFVVTGRKDHRSSAAAVALDDLVG